VKTLVCTLAVSLLVAAGCFNPSVKNGGFLCSGPEDGQCPTGFFCVNGVCLDSPNGNPGNGGSGTTGRDMMSSSNEDLSGAVVDMTMGASNDMARTMSVPDMARPRMDMALSTGNSCAHSYCTVGAKLAKSCDPCVTTICAKYSNCCTTSWIDKCVADVNTLCSSPAHCP
jgi:hypothetical protein